MSRIFGFTFFLLLLAAFALISLKGMRPIPASTSLADVMDIDWTLISVDDEMVGNISRVTLRLKAGGKMNGHGECNDFFADYTVSEAGIEIGTIGVTRKACAASQVNPETALLDALGRTSGLGLRGHRLVLTDPDGGVLAIFERVSPSG